MQVRPTSRRRPKLDQQPNLQTKRNTSRMYPAVLLSSSTSAITPDLMLSIQSWRSLALDYHPYLRFVPRTLNTSYQEGSGVVIRLALYDAWVKLICRLSQYKSVDR